MTTLARDRGTGTALRDIVLARATELDAAEAGIATGLAHALRGVGFAVAEREDGGAGRMAVVVSPLEHVDATLARVRDVDAFVYPLVRGPGEVRGWSALGERVSGLWTGLRPLADELTRALAGRGAAAHWIGASCQLGAPRHVSRRAVGLRDEDVICAAFLDADSPAGRLEVLCDAWSELVGADRFARATLLVSAATDGQERHLREWGSEHPETVVVTRYPADPLLLRSLIEVSDCEVYCGSAARLPWTAASSLFLGRPVVDLAGLAAGAFGGGDPQHLHRLAVADATVVAGVLQRVVTGDAGDRDAARTGMRQMMLECSARAVAVRIVAALRAAGRWQALATDDDR